MDCDYVWSNLSPSFNPINHSSDMMRLVRKNCGPHRNVKEEGGGGIAKSGAVSIQERPRSCSCRKRYAAPRKSTPNIAAFLALVVYHDRVIQRRNRRGSLRRACALSRRF